MMVKQFRFGLIIMPNKLLKSMLMVRKIPIKKNLTMIQVIFLIVTVQSMLQKELEACQLLILKILILQQNF